jgi:hypothetical protein
MRGGPELLFGAGSPLELSGPRTASACATAANMDAALELERAKQRTLELQLDLERLRARNSTSGSDNARGSNA